MDWMPRIGLTGAALLWASSFIALKMAFCAYDPMVVIFGRMAIASVCFLFFIGRFRRIEYRPGDLKWLAFMAFCEPCLYFIFEAMALKNTQIAEELALPPVKIHCSILAEDAIKAAVADYKHKHGSAAGSAEYTACNPPKEH